MTACTRCATLLEDGDLRCAICALPAPAPVRATIQGEAPPRAQVLRCGGCGAAVAFVAEARAPRCGFCGATMAIEQPVDPLEVARLRLPFTVDREAAERALRGWLARRGWFDPPALASEAVLDALTPLSWAAWLVNAEALVAWTADSDAGARRSAWAPHAGEAELEFRDIVVPASRGLGEAEARRLIPHYQLGRAVPVPPPDGARGPGLGPLGGAPVSPPAPPPVPPGDAAEIASTIEQFDAQRSAARRFVQDRIEATAKVRVEPHIPGRRYRNVRVACLIERQTTERIALPAWILAYRYRGKPYRAIVHGQRADVVLGRSPLDWAKLGMVAAAVAALAAIVALLVWAR